MQPNVDYIADKLAWIAAIGRNMPPSWDGAKITIPVISPCGEARIGKVLPGRGLYLDCDLKSVGIIKRIPYVYERTPVMRLAEKFRSERAAVAAAAVVAAASMFTRGYLAHILGPLALGTIATYDNIIAARASGGATDVVFAKSSLTTVANTWSALFDTGGLPLAGTYSASPGAALNSASAGALSFGLPNTSGSNNAYLLTFGFTAAQTINMAILADLLVAVGSVLVNNSTVTISSAALTRYTGGAGVLVTFEVTTQLSGTNAGSCSFSYTNQAGTSGQTSSTQAFTTSGIVGRLMPVTFGPFWNLASGDYGVRAVASLTSASANTTTGVVALHMYFPLAFVPGIAANVYVERDSTIQIDGLTQIQASSNVLGCLTMYVVSSAASSGLINGFMRTVQG